MPNYVSGIGSVEPKLMIIGEAPGKYEDEQGIPFVGPTGRILDECLFKAGISRSECYITNVIKYRPPFNDLKKLHLIGVDIGQSMQELWDNEINVLKPYCILAVGDLAFQAVCDCAGIMNYRGSILSARDGITKVVPTIHPAALFSRTIGSGDDAETAGGLKWTWLKLIEADIARAAEESLTRSINLPERSLAIAHNSLDLHRFFREYEKLDLCASDIESINCVPVCIGFAFNKHHAISVPLLRSIGNNKLTDMGDNEMDECWKIIDTQLRRLRLIGHNFKYDEYKLSLIGFETPNVVSDTLIKTRVIFPEMPKKRLCDVSSIWTREPFYKDDGKEFKLGKSKIDQLLIYNGRDCAVEFEVDEVQDQDLLDLSERFSIPLVEYYRQQMKKHKLYLKMENAGKRVDRERQKELKIKYKEMRDLVHSRIEGKIGHEVNVKSTPQMFDLLYKEMKFKIRKKAPTSEDSIVALMGGTKKKDQKEILSDVLEERRIRDQLSRQINFSPDYDGRCRSSYNIIATETCRSSTGILKKPLRPKKIGLAEHTISAHGRLGKDIKSMFIADEGTVVLQADSSQAEPRVVAVLSEDWELLKAFEEKVDIHRRTAGLIFGYTAKLELSSSFKHPIVDFLPKDGPERYTGKTTRNAGNYNVGKRTFMTTFNTNAQKFEIPMDISEWRAGQMLEIFHSASPKVRGRFHQDIKDAIDSSRVIIDPFGGVRVFNGRMDDEIYKEGYANIPQRTVSHVVQNAAIAIDEELGCDDRFLWIGEKHDALYMQVPESNWEVYARLMKKHMEKGIDFRTYCTLKRDITLVIPCEIEMSSTNYAAFEKVKL